MGDISREPAAGGGTGSDANESCVDGPWDGRRQRPTPTELERRGLGPDLGDPATVEDAEVTWLGGGSLDVARLPQPTATDASVHAPVSEREQNHDQSDLDAETPSEADGSAAEVPLAEAPLAEPADAAVVGAVGGEARAEAPAEAPAEANVELVRAAADDPAAEFADVDTLVEPAVAHDADPDTDDAMVELAATQEATATGAPGDELAAVVPLTDPAELGRVLSAVLLTSREPLSIFRLAQICDATQQAVREGLDMLEAEFRRSGLPLTVARTDDTIRVLTLPEVAPYLERSRGIKKAERLSPAALETLAVVAYRQPVMRVEIEAIRGVKVGPMLRTLLEHKLVTIVGRADVPGRPLQYGTTQQFLDRFGLASLRDLPSLKEAKSLG